VDYDITFYPTSSLTKQNDLNRLHNVRTPRFNLTTCMAKRGDDEPFIYRIADPGRFLIEPANGEREHVLPRNLEAVALIGD
jgi:hypothetical protein